MDVLTLQKKGKVRATLLAVLSRGLGCARFNAPAVYGSVGRAFSWIRETIEKEMGGSAACPSTSRGQDYQDQSLLKMLAQEQAQEQSQKHEKAQEQTQGEEQNSQPAAPQNPAPPYHSINYLVETE
jgi:hypothetical protein